MGGKELFVQRCGGCHVLADAGTLGQTGPSLDDAFFAAREQGFPDSTFFEVTLEKMRIPGYGSVMPSYDDPNDPDNFLEHDQLVSVADYVASVAGTGAEAAPADSDDPQALFTTACGSCHVLSEAGTTGTVGPSLDEYGGPLEDAVEQIRNGGGGMPPFEGQLTEEQIRLLAEYVTSRR